MNRTEIEIRITLTIQLMSNRRKGNAFECKLARDFREIGYPMAATSRSESKSRDDQGVDLVHTGHWNVQAKAWKAAPSYHEVLNKMPTEPGQMNILVHKRPRKGSVVVMSYDDFLEVARWLRREQIVKDDRIIHPLTQLDSRQAA